MSGAVPRVGTTVGRRARRGDTSLAPRRPGAPRCAQGGVRLEAVAEEGAAVEVHLDRTDVAARLQETGGLAERSKR